MSKKTGLTVVMLLAAALLLCGCTYGVDSASQDIYDRLDELDDFKEWAAGQPVPEQTPFEASRYGAFRDVPFGYHRGDVLESEPLAIVEEYDNAIDYEYISVFGYDMLPTYWFNKDDVLYRGSYYAQIGEDMHGIIDSLQGQLTDLYGTPLETSYYDYDNDAVYFDSDRTESEAVSSGNAYYFAWYFAEDVDIEVYIEGAPKDETDFGFDVFVNFTDYVYYD